MVDPWLPSKISVDKSDIKIGRRAENKEYDAILICVGHDKFKEQGFEEIKKIAAQDAVIFDIKNVYPDQPGLLRFIGTIMLSTAFKLFAFIKKESLFLLIIIVTATFLEMLGAAIFFQFISIISSDSTNISPLIYWAFNLIGLTIQISPSAS